MECGQRRLLIDIHAHLLPGVDDGARNMEEAIELMEHAKVLGISTFIVTPHDSRRRGSDGIREAFEELRSRVQERDPDIALYLGQETYYHEDLPERLMEGNAFTLGNSGYVLVEFAPGVSWQVVGRAVRKLTAAGYTPVIAHVERYRCLREKGRLLECRRSGCLLQMNYDSLQGKWFSPETRWCRKQVKEGNIHFLATDMHRTDFRPPDVKRALEWLYANVEPGLFLKMTFQNAEKVLNNEKIS